MIQPNNKRILMTGCDTTFGHKLMMSLIESGHFIASIGTHPGDNYQYDLTKLGWNDYDDIIDEIDRHYAGEWFDALLNCASFDPCGSIMDASELSIMDDLSVNLLAPLAIMKHFVDRCEGLRIMPERIPKEGGWRIINLVDDRFAKTSLVRATEILAKDLITGPYIFANIMPFINKLDFADSIKIFKFVIEEMTSSMTGITIRIPSLT